MVLVEGKNRQIRKTLEHLNCRVENLVRIQIGELPLGELKPGEIRAIHPGEIGIPGKQREREGERAAK